MSSATVWTYTRSATIDANARPIATAVERLGTNGSSTVSTRDRTARLKTVLETKSPSVILGTIARMKFRISRCPNCDPAFASTVTVSVTTRASAVDEAPAIVWRMARAPSALRARMIDGSDSCPSSTSESTHPVSEASRNDASPIDSGSAHSDEFNGRRLRRRRS